MMRHILEYDTARHKPFRIQVHPLEIAGKQWGLGFGRAAPYSHGQCILMIDGIKMVRRDIDQHILLMLLRTIRLSPAATFHIHQNLGSHRLAQSRHLQLLSQLLIKCRLGLHIMQKSSQGIGNSVLIIPCTIAFTTLYNLL